MALLIPFTMVMLIWTGVTVVIIGLILRLAYLASGFWEPFSKTGHWQGFAIPIQAAVAIGFCLPVLWLGPKMTPSTMAILIWTGVAVAIIGLILRYAYPEVPSFWEPFSKTGHWQGFAIPIQAAVVVGFSLLVLWLGPKTEEIVWLLKTESSKDLPWAQLPLPDASLATPPLTKQSSLDKDIERRAQDLQEFVDAKNKVLAEINKALKEKPRNQVRTIENYDRLIRVVQDTLEKIGPDSDFQKDLDKGIAASRSRANQVSDRLSPDSSSSDNRFSKIESGFEKVKSDSAIVHEHGLNAIRALEQGKETATFLIKVNALDKARNLTAKQLATVHSIIDETEKLGREIPYATGR